jgi:hypothetical protein
MQTKLSDSLSLSVYPADSTRGAAGGPDRGGLQGDTTRPALRHTRATLDSDAAAGIPGEACSQRVNASFPLTRSGGRSWDREASHAMEVCSQRVGCEQRVAHMHRQKSGLRSFCRWGVANRGCELGALRPSPAGLKAASVARSNSTVTQIEAVPGPSLLPGRVHLTHLVRVRGRARARLRARIRVRVRALLHLTTCQGIGPCVASRPARKVLPS